MDDVETGYYLELKGTPEMTKTHINQPPDEPHTTLNSNESATIKPDSSPLLNRPSRADNESINFPVNKLDKSSSFLSDGSEEFLDSVNELYGVDKVKTKLYKEFFKLYTHRQDETDSDNFPADSYDRFVTGRYGSFETGRVRKKVFLWIMILVLVSNPILGGYNLYHFSNYPRLFSGLSASELTDNMVNSGADASVSAYSLTNKNRLSTDSSNSTHDEDYTPYIADEFTRQGWSFNPFRWLTMIFNGSDTQDAADGSVTKGSRDDQEFQNRLTQAQDRLKNNLLSVSKFVGKKVSRYCFFEIFGEIIFGIFSLLILSLCRLPCNNSNSIRFMIPTLFMFYMIIYRILACYILITSFKIIFYFLLAYNPDWSTKLPSLVLYLFSFKNLDLSHDLHMLRRMYELDKLNIRLLLVFCLQNVYITFSETLEMFSFFFKVFVSSFNKKILKKNDLNFYYSSESGGFKLFKKCFSRDTFSSSDPHEKYIHSLYNYASDIGTYLKNIEISDYTKGLDDLANKFKNRKLNTDNY